MLQRICILICVISLIATTALAQPAPAQGPPPTGSGPYPAVIEGDPGVPGHTIYRPENLSAFSQKNSLPVVAWGNGGCANSSTFYAPFLAEIASQGFLVVAIGPFTPGDAPNRGGMGGGMGMGSRRNLLNCWKPSIGRQPRISARTASITRNWIRQSLPYSATAVEDCRHWKYRLIRA